MKRKAQYIRPEAEAVVLKDRLMLELPLSETVVDDEAAKGGLVFDDEQDGGSGTQHKRRGLWDD